ncbi:alpha-2-macroglobulin-like protein 1 [Archocentrus centrarchus]|uniref:alpha-2-macroglobulin-like protein 1 n=1 Tax=Archocentrus centrarchus TaxID=63155 RepID=UPI0011EA3858|nr:alpha-2-macroglobulin-like protein 1 [Archocentrus centrarchus]
MGRPGIVVWAWALGAFLSWIHVGQAEQGLQYFVAVPAVLEAGAETKFCVNVLKLTSPVVVNVTLIAAKSQSLLTLQTCMLDVHTCIDFKVPIVANEEVMDFVVEVKGSIFHSKEVRKVLVKAYNPMTFVQTDKPIYLPGQKVHFRVVTLDTKLRPSSELYDLIELEDPNNNRIGQWLNTNSNSKILQLSYSLSPEAREGTYKITVTIGENKIHHTFNVEKYVLPRFDITVKVPEEVSIGQDSFEVKACSKYTFGQPVPGKVKVHMCRPLQRYFPISPLIRVAHPNDQPNPKDETTPVCQSETKQADKTGCAIFKFNISAFTEMEKAVQDILEIKTEKEEEGTGVLISEEKRITITYLIGKVVFIDTPNIYERGAIVEGKVKAVYHNGAPISGNKVYVFEGDRWSPRSVQNVTTDRNGVALFTLHTDDLKGNVQLYASLTSTLDYPGYRTAYYEIGFHTLSVSKPASPDENTVSFLVVKTKDKPLPCKTVQKITIQYTIVGETPGPVDLIYLVLSRGAIFIQGHKKIDVKSETVNEGEVFFNLNVSPEMAPDIQIVAYAVLPSENVIAQTADFSTEKCFANKVSVDFVPPSAVPGEETDFQVKALPNSLCGVSAIDQSVLIKEPGKTLDAEKIFDLLPVRKLTYIPYEVQDPVECMEVRPKRSILPFPEFDKNDAYTVFQSVGLKMATNMFIQMPSCLRYRGKEYYQGYGFKGGQVYKIDLVHRLPAAAAVAPGIAPETSPIKTVRTFFPETWIWELVEIRESGTKNMTLTVPDTITTWETEAFCLSSEGFGLAPPEKMKVFQPFFLELTMPYSIIRGEFFELKATIFSFLTTCMMVTVTPTPSSEYILTSLSGDEYTSCLCASERRTVSWSMVPKALGVLNVTISAEAVASGVSCGKELVTVPERGRIDVITKSLIVKPEGVMVTKIYNLLLIPTGKTVREEVVIKLPYNVIEDSARAFISVLGDILGRALKNLEGLLQLPSGCGEQNMILLAPNIFILQYLKSTQQLTPAVEEKATSYMIVGYQNQLHYKHADGAYSAFGTGEGNTWLTALVVKCFAQAEEFIYIDPKNIELSKTWLENQQRENGCFKQSGKLFHNGMKGGVSDEVTLSAYITAVFLENKKFANSSVVNRSLACLKEFTNDLSNTYTTALLAYVFTLARDQVTRAHLLEHLDKVAIKQGSFIYWSQKSVETSTSLSVEISSYVLLAQISSSPTAEELGYASGIVRWLTDQQNYYGGFSSTQDTVVALQALALYSTTLFSIPVFSSKGSSKTTGQSSQWGSSKVAVNCPNSQLTFHVNRNNRLLYQEETILKDVAGKYIVEMKGTATVSVQITVQYNIPNSYGSSTLRVEVRVEYHSSRSPRPKLTLIIKSLYSGKESSTNMVILDIKLLSGHVPDPESLRKLKDAPLVDRIEQKEDHVLVYLRELVKDTPVEHSLDLIEEYPVDNLKPAMVVLYDFYEPTDRAEDEYLYPYCGGQQSEMEYLYV